MECCRRLRAKKVAGRVTVCCQVRPFLCLKKVGEEEEKARLTTPLLPDKCVFLSPLSGLFGSFEEEDRTRPPAGGGLSPPCKIKKKTRNYFFFIPILLLFHLARTASVGPATDRRQRVQRISRTRTCRHLLVKEPKHPTGQKRELFETTF